MRIYIVLYFKFQFSVSWNTFQIYSAEFEEYYKKYVSGIKSPPRLFVYREKLVSYSTIFSIVLVLKPLETELLQYGSPARVLRLIEKFATTMFILLLYFIFFLIINLRLPYHFFFFSDVFKTIRLRRTFDSWTKTRKSSLPSILITGFQ